jgi:hypothetical protein
VNNLENSTEDIGIDYVLGLDFSKSWLSVQQTKYKPVAIHIESILPIGIIGIIADAIWTSLYHERPNECKIWPAVIILAHSGFSGP